jgi:hypothetical protein
VWSLPYPYKPVSGSGFTVTLDNDGNATAVILGGPGCAPGESLISAHMEQAPFTTVTSAFTVLAPRPTLSPRVTATPKEEVETEDTSSVATIVQVEFPPVYAEAYVNVNAEQLYSRCHIPPKLVWVGEGGELLGQGVDTINGVQLDNDGNAFVVLLGGGSCASGSSLIEASLEDAPYTTYTTTFTILPPQPTLPVAPEFTVEKLQRIEGEGAFTMNELIGELGQVVEYKIIVANTGNTPLEFSNFSDPHCSGIGGGPEGKTVQPGQSTTFTCSHTLTSVGSWTNVCTIKGNEGTGNRECNEVVVNVPPPGPVPAYRIEKRQRIDSEGSFTKNELTGKIGQVVNYEIIVANTGNVPLEFSNFTDADCEGISGGPGNNPVPVSGSTTYTCSHTLTSTGTWANVASVEGNEGTGKKTSNEVIVNVPPESNQVVLKASEPKTEQLPAKCAALAGKFVLKGATGPKRHKFTVKISSKGIKSVTFYLDGRRIKTLPAAAARRSTKKHAAAKRAAAKKDAFFTITVDPHNLKYGRHTVSVTAELNDPQCGPIKLTTAFVHPRAGSSVVKFTG